MTSDGRTQAEACGDVPDAASKAHSDSSSDFDSDFDVDPRMGPLVEWLDSDDDGVLQQRSQCGSDSDRDGPPRKVPRFPGQSLLRCK